jgi:hypothetical protein
MIPLPQDFDLYQRYSNQGADYGQGYYSPPTRIFRPSYGPDFEYQANYRFERGVKMTSRVKKKLVLDIVTC